MIKQLSTDLISARQVAFFALQQIYHNQSYTDLALEKCLTDHQLLKPPDKGLVSELVYGIVRRKRTLDSLINQLGSKKARQQPLNLRIILHLGLYQLRYLDKIPPAAAVNTSVELAKQNGLPKLAGVVNGILRGYLRKSQSRDPLKLPLELIPRLGIQYSFPDWIVQTFLNQLDQSEVEQLLDWYNQPAHIDLRVNCLKITREELQAKLQAEGIKAINLANLPHGLRLTTSVGKISQLWGFNQGYFTIQDGSAQLVSYLLAPQPGETIIDACAAPGGKSTHIAELMQNQGIVWACDRLPSRLAKIQENSERLGLTNIKIEEGDSSNLTKFFGIADRVLVDAPCSGLGTLHRHPDIRWQKKPENIKELTKLQLGILTNAATWVKEGGVLVYATCTLNPRENEAIINSFLQHHPDWQIVTIPHNLSQDFGLTSEGMIKIYPHRQQMDGFFMVKLTKKNTNKGD
jgi:16S rRNA (cytosine967-C5)-methyltransferase